MSLISAIVQGAGGKTHKSAFWVLSWIASAADLSSTDLLLEDEPSSKCGGTVSGILRWTPTVIVTM